MSWDDIGKLMLRLAIAVLLMFHGVAKLQHGIGWMRPMLQSNHLPVFLGYGVFVAEIVAPILLIMGVFARIGGLVIAFDLLMAILLARRNDLFTINRGGGSNVEVELLFLLGGVAIFFLGSGRLSLRKGAGRWD